MKKNKILMLLTFCLAITTWSQENAYFDWVRPFGSTENDKGRGLAVDSQGNTYTTGEFRGTCNFNPNSSGGSWTSSGSSDGFLTKHDANGNYIFSVPFGGPGADFGKNIEIDPAGNILVTGRMGSGAGFGSFPGSGSSNSAQLTASGNRDVFIAKYSPTGALIWAKNVGGSSTQSNTDEPGDIALDQNGNVYVTGKYRGTGDFDPGSGTFNLTPSDNAGDIFILKLDSDGNFVWAKSVGGYSDYVYTIEYDQALNWLYVGGSYTQTGDFDPGVGIHTLTTTNGQSGNSDIFILKLDNNGDFLWVKSLGGNTDDRCVDIELDSFGNLTSTGSFSGTADFDPNSGTSNLTSNGSSDIFFMRMTAAGNLVWAKRVGGISEDSGSGIAIDAQNHFYFTGEFTTTTDFDPGPGVHNLSASGGRNIFVIKLTPDGNFVWAEKAGVTFASDVGNDIVIDNDKNLYLTGHFANSTSSTTDFDPSPDNNTNTVSQGDLDGYVWKLHQCTSTDSTITVHTCSNYTAPDGQIYTTSGQYSAIIPNASGCDSTITINLSVGSPSNASITETACNSYVAADGQEYTSSGQYTAIVTNASGCDSTISIDLTINTVDTTVIVSNGGTFLMANAMGSDITYQWLDCIANSSEIPNETGQSYIPSSTGYYALEITDNLNNCVDTSSCYNIAVLGMDDLHIENLKIYPNPTNGKFNIDLSQFQEEVEISILNSLGQLIHNQLITHSSEETAIELDAPSGVYHVIISAKNQQIQKKLIKR